MLPHSLGLFALCLALACGEMLNGIVRIRWIAPRLGRQPSQAISVVSGTLLAGAICAYFIPHLGLAGPALALPLGLGLAGFMAVFDIALGRLLLRRPWRTIAQDFNPYSGNYLVFGLIALTLIPSLLIRLGLM